MIFPAHPLPASPPRVVVSGAGIVTALGTGWGKNADGFRAGKTAFRPVTLFDVSRQRVKTAAEADLPEKMPATLLNARQSARLDRASALLLLKVAAVVGLYRFLFTRGPLWKIWNSNKPAVETATLASDHSALPEDMAAAIGNDRV